MPKPTGEFVVGSTTFHLIDKTRKEIFSDNPNDLRELMIYVWYPTGYSNSSNNYGLKKMQYTPIDISKYIKEKIAKEEKIPLNKITPLTNVPTNSFYKAPISQKQAKYPIILFSHGLSKPIFMYSSILEELANHGYIVIGINHTYFSDATEFPNGRVINYKMHKFPHFNLTEGINIWIHDVQFVLDQLKIISLKHFDNKFNFNNIGVFGHSFGGSLATEILRIDNRFKAGVNIDGAFYEANPETGFNKPFMMILAERFFLVKHEPTENDLKIWGLSRQQYIEMIENNLEIISNLFNNLTKDHYLIIIKNAFHNTFSDWYLFLPEISSRINSLKGIEITRSLLLTFFDVYLRNKNAKELNQIFDKYKDYLEVKDKQISFDIL